MRPRIAIGRFLSRPEGFIQELPLLVMKADDPVQFSRRTYAKPHQAKVRLEDDLVYPGLNRDEEARCCGKTAPETGRFFQMGRVASTG